MIQGIKGEKKLGDLPRDISPRCSYASIVVMQIRVNQRVRLYGWARWHETRKISGNEISITAISWTRIALPDFIVRHIAREFHCERIITILYSQSYKNMSTQNKFNAQPTYATSRTFLRLLEWWNFLNRGTRESRKPSLAANSWYR